MINYETVKTNIVFQEKIFYKKRKSNILIAKLNLKLFFFLILRSKRISRLFGEVEILEWMGPNSIGFISNKKSTKSFSSVRFDSLSQVEYFISRKIRSNQFSVLKMRENCC